MTTKRGSHPNGCTARECVAVRLEPIAVSVEDRSCIHQESHNLLRTSDHSKIERRRATVATDVRIGALSQQDAGDILLAA